MLAKTIRHMLPFVALVYFSTCALHADEALAPLADPANALKALQSKIDALRKEGKNEAANQLEIERSKAILRVAGVQVPSMPELHAELPLEPGSEGELPKGMLLSPDPSRALPLEPDSEGELPKVIQPKANPSNPAKEQRVRSLLAAASSLKAAGLEEDSARYERLASKLARNDDSVEVIRLRDEVAELRGEVEHLRKEIEGIAVKPSPFAPVPQNGRLGPTPLYAPPPATFQPANPLPTQIISPR